MNTLQRIENNEDYIYVATDQDGNHVAAIAAHFSPEAVSANVSKWLLAGHNVNRVPRKKFRENRPIIYIKEK